MSKKVIELTEGQLISLVEKVSNQVIQLKESENKTKDKKLTIEERLAKLEKEGGK